MTLFGRALILGLAMGAASVAPSALRFSGSERAAPAFDLEVVVPKKFGAWREQAIAVQVVNPQVQEVVDRVYSHVLTRAYIDDSGYRIMLTIAYGNDQRGNLEVHRPEVCYPAQGFTVHRNDDDRLATRLGSIAVRRLDTSLGPRQEPLTYWTTIDNEVVRNRFEKRVAEIGAVVSGRIPDGMLVRVSSIDADRPRAWKAQDRFVNDLLESLSQSNRTRMAGLSQAAP
jgi:EpsI family protein